MFSIMAKFLNKISQALDGELGMEPDEQNTCPFSEGCKRRLSPGDILRYSVVLSFSVFLILFVISLFFPKLIPHPNLQILKELIDIIHISVGASI